MIGTGGLVSSFKIKSEKALLKSILPLRYTNLFWINVITDFSVAIALGTEPN